MGNVRCPHFVRHGRAEGKGEDKKIVYYDRCGLKMRTSEHVSCLHHPFESTFNYMGCEIYHQTFRPSSVKNDVIPTKDFQYSESLSSEPITDMKLL